MLHEIRRRFGSPGRTLDEREMRELSVFLFEYLAGGRKDWDLVSRRAEAPKQTQTWLVPSAVVDELHRRAREQRAGALRTVGALSDDQQVVLRPAVTAMEAAFSLMERNIEAVQTVWNRLFPGSATAS